MLMDEELKLVDFFLNMNVLLHSLSISSFLSKQVMLYGLRKINFRCYPLQNDHFRIKHFVLHRLYSNWQVGIIGAPFSKGQPISGVEKGPSIMRNFGLVRELQKIGIDIEDFGDLQFPDIEEDDNEKLKHPLTVASACQKVSNAVSKILEERKICLTLGGDHSLGIGTVHGHSQVYSDLCVLWVDAHADINTAATTRTGNLHGMPCSFIIHELEKYRKHCSGFDWIKPCVKKRNFAYIGLRDIDPMEKLILRNEGILHFSMRDIDRLGIFEVANRALEAINPLGNLSVHVSFDIDSIDKSITPSTGTPVLGGLTLREALCLAEEISKIDTLHAVDLVELNPTIGSKEQVENTVISAILVLKTIFGYSRTGNFPQTADTIPVF